MRLEGGILDAALHEMNVAASFAGGSLSGAHFGLAVNGRTGIDKRRESEGQISRPAAHVQLPSLLRKVQARGDDGEKLRWIRFAMAIELNGSFKPPQAPLPALSDKDSRG